MRFPHRAKLYIDLSPNPNPSDFVWVYLGEYRARTGVLPGAFKTSNNLFDRGKVNIMFNANSALSLRGGVAKLWGTYLIKISVGSLDQWYIINNVSVNEKFVQAEGTEYFGDTDGL